MATSSFFYEGSAAPEQNTVAELIVDLEAKVAAAQEASNAAQNAANASAASASSSHASETSAASYLAQTQTALSQARAAQAAAESALVSVNAALAATNDNLAATNAAKVAAQAAQALAETANANAQSAKTAAQASATAAASSQTAAASSASAASTSASNASTSATNASSSATAAASSASSASTSATSASGSASTATTQATNAASSASSALASKNAAATSETNAASSATSAATQASNAASSASSAATSATNASTSASNAASSASSTAALLATFRSIFLGAFASDSAAASFASANSISIVDGIMYENTVSDKFRIYNGSAWQDYDSSAQASQSAAALSAANAASSAGAASTSASNASTSATNAANSATAAAGSATNAANSATSAASSASSASTSATNAANSYTAFHNVYQGSYASAPTTRPDSSALRSGDLYFNTTTNTMKVYNGTVWLDAYATLSGALLSTNNLSDLNSASTARTNLGLATVAATGTYSDLTGKPSLATVATTGSYTDLINKPTIPTVPTTVSSFTNDAGYVTQAGARSAISATGSLSYNSTTGVISYTAPTLATVATSGSYTDLINKPTIPTVPTTVSSFTNDSGYITRVVSVNDTSDGLRVTQAGTGNSFVVEDSTNPDSTPFVIDNAGNVGVGTTTMVAKMNVAAATDGVVIQSTNGTVGHRVSYILSGVAYTGTSNAYPLSLMTVGTEAIRIDTSQRVGIGKNNPSTILDVNGTVTATGLSDSGNLTFTGTGNRITGDFSNATVASRVAFQTSTTNGNTIVGTFPNGTGTTSVFRAFNNSDPANSSQATFGVNTVSVFVDSALQGTGTYLPLTMNTGGSERLRIDTSGNVGIGSTSPAYYANYKTLAIQGPSTTYGGVVRTQSSDSSLIGLFYVDSTGLFVKSATSNPLILGTADTERMRIDTSGNVGIGLTNPSSQLHQYLASGTTYRQNQNGTVNITEYASTAVALASYGTTSNHPLQFTTNNTVRMLISSAGVITTSNIVGINGGAPATDYALNITGSTGINGGLVCFNSGATTSTVLYNDASAGYLITRNATSLVLGTNNTERVRIGSAGQLGIGGANYGTSGQVLTSGGSGAAPSWASVSGVGSGQTWSDVTASRSAGTQYTNSTGKPIQLSVNGHDGRGGQAGYIYVTIGGVVCAYSGSPSNSSYARPSSTNPIVPAGSTYQVDVGEVGYDVIQYWYELR